MDNIKKALRDANARLYQDRYFSNAKHHAQEALQGRTHYVDDSTLKFFSARITEARPIMDGLFYEIMESTSKDMNNTARGFRVVVFDVFGETVYRPDLSELRSTSAAARKAYEKEFTIDAAEHYSATLKAKAFRLQKESAAMAEAAEQVTA